MNATGVLLVIVGGAMFSAAVIAILFERFGLWAGLGGVGVGFVLAGRTLLTTGVRK